VADAVCGCNATCLSAGAVLADLYNLSVWVFGLVVSCRVLDRTTCIRRFISSSQQDAQLSQRDRAAGCVIVFAKSGRLELGDFTDIIGLSSTTVI